MNRVLALVAILMVAPTFLQAANAGENARDLARNCKGVVTGTTGKGKHVQIPNTRGALLCWGYMQAMQDLSVLVDQDGQRVIGSCAPEDMTLLQLIELFVTYADKHPADMHSNAAVKVMKSLQQAFPCSSALSN